jgi:hypothetical protein
MVRGCHVRSYLRFQDTAKRVLKIRLNMFQKVSCDALGRPPCLPTQFLGVVRMQRLGLVMHGVNVRARRMRPGSCLGKHAGWDSVDSCRVGGGEEG